MKKSCSILSILLFLTACSNEPSNKDLEVLANTHVSKLTSILHAEGIPGLTISKISGFNDIIIDGVEKIQCTPENNNVKIYLCDVLVRYEIIVSENSLSQLVGFSGKKTELRKIKLLKSNIGWEMI